MIPLYIRRKVTDTGDKPSVKTQENVRICHHIIYVDNDALLQGFCLSFKLRMIQSLKVKAVRTEQFHLLHATDI